MRRLGVGICVVFSGCGRSGFDLVDAQPTDTVDTVDAVDAGCWPAWTTGPLRLTTPARVSELATSAAQGDPSLSPDGLTLYFSQGSSGKDYYATRRADRTAPWGAPSRLDDLSSTGDDTKLTLSDDGLVAIVSSDRAPATSFDLWEATRASAAVPFGTPTRTPLTAINNNSAQYDPQLSGDGLRLYYAPDVGGTQVIELATRSSRAEAFGMPVELALGAGSIADPSPSPDELVMFYTVHANGPTAMFYATRTTATDSFGAGQKLPLYDVPVFDQDPAISHDGCELYFASMRGGSVLQLYMTAVQ